ncbi:MAG: substrate-binding domain-containing protein [Verrucomicrobia bacterium]|nr:substrate-binding domain-containing protein [Verrucomicrobiota bacterium]MCH8512351.1 substrate-binding domain-containing protein [Kiritimatiellia bacterium]
MKHDPEIRIACHIIRTIPYGAGILRGIIEWSRNRMNCRIQNYVHFEDMRPFKPHGIIALLGNKKALAAATSFSIPVVNVSSGQPNIPFPTVTTDNVAVGRFGAEHLLSIGLEQFAFARSPWTYFSRLRQAGFEETLRERGKTALPTYVQGESEEGRSGDGYPHPPSMEVWLRKLPTPCGIMTDTEEMAGCLLSCAKHCSLRVPDDIAVVTADQDEWFCELSDPPLSCVPLMGQSVGWNAAEMLDRLLQGDPLPPKPLLLSPDPVVVRQSSDLLHIPDEHVCRALRFIRAHPHQRMTVPQVVSAAGVNRRTLEIQFRRYVHRTILEEINLAHLHEARRLLRETHLPMIEVSEQSGFPNPERMTLVFKRETGFTPLAYRKQVAPKD